MTNTKINNYYMETTYGIIPINSNNEIRVVTSNDIRTNEMLVDIRKYTLYGNQFDNIKKATRKGIKFKLHNIKNIMLGLSSILKEHKLMTEEDYNTIYSILTK